MNKPFFETIFNKEEQQVILPTLVDNHIYLRNGQDTEDRLFLSIGIGKDPAYHAGTDGRELYEGTCTASKYVFGIDKIVSHC